MYSMAEDGRALLEAARELHAERHGAQTFTPGTHLPLEEAAGRRTGIDPNRLRYHDAIKELEYEGAIEWDERARYARGDKHHASPSAAWMVPGRASRVNGFPRQQPGGYRGGRMS